MLVTTNTLKLAGMDGIPVTVECEITRGIGIHLVGLADAACKESLLRTVTAMMALGYKIPGEKIVINLAPADLYKGGSGYDLAIAMAIIAASKQEDISLGKWLFLGELGLDGSLRSVPGAVQAVLLARKAGFKCIIPMHDKHEVEPFVEDAFEDNYPVYALNNLAEVIELVTGRQKFESVVINAEPFPCKDEGNVWDMMVGNVAEKRALEIAAAGGHHLLLVGAPGSGKSALAKALVEILPPMTHTEEMECSAIYSASGRGFMEYYKGKRPFRAPHYSASMVELLGGGAGENIHPGEVSLAHNGVLFLDEFAETPKSYIEALRGPMEDKKVKISRLKSVVEYPASFQLVAASNPCPCGYNGEGDRCTCTIGQRLAYLSRLSGPVVDMITMQVWVHPPISQVFGQPSGQESMTEVRYRVKKARDIQAKRYANEPYKLNDAMPAAAIEKYSHLTDAAKQLLETVMERLCLSARSYTRIIKIARTIADLAGEDMVQPEHVAEAAAFRFLDRSAHQLVHEVA